MRESARSQLPARYIGLELAGAKNQKTALAALEYYPKEKKIFLLDIYDKITPHNGQTGDEALLEVIDEIRPNVAKMGVNVPLTLPPCLGCSRRACVAPHKCTSPAVTWMRKTALKASKTQRRSRLREFTPYTQRPVELWVRHHVFPELDDDFHFEIDETLGGNKAPLTARMDFLKRCLKGLPLLEVWPKLTMAVIAKDLGLEKRIITRYRHLEEGVHSRNEVLERLSDKHGIFIYERDLKKLSHSLAAFDAFICAYTALLADLERCAKIPRGFPVSSGWIQYPELKS